MPIIEHSHQYNDHRLIHHRKFHEGMIQAVVKDLNEEQQEILVKSLLNLRAFFDSYQKKP